MANALPSPSVKPSAVPPSGLRFLASGDSYDDLRLRVSALRAGCCFHRRRKAAAVIQTAAGITRRRKASLDNLRVLGFFGKDNRLYCIFATSELECLPAAFHRVGDSLSDRRRFDSAIGVNLNLGGWYTVRGGGLNIWS